MGISKSPPCRAGARGPDAPRAPGGGGRAGACRQGPRSSHTSAHTHMYVHMCWHRTACVCTLALTHTHLHRQPPLDTHRDPHIHTHTYMYTYKHTHTHPNHSLNAHDPYTHKSSQVSHTLPCTQTHRRAHCTPPHTHTYVHRCSQLGHGCCSCNPSCWFIQAHR